MLTGRQRSKLRGRLKRRFRLTRRELGAIGAGHAEPRPGYDHVLLGVLEIIRARRAAFAAATPSRRPTARRKGRTGGVYTKRAEKLIQELRRHDGGRADRLKRRYVGRSIAELRSRFTKEGRRK